MTVGTDDDENEPHDDEEWPQHHDDNTSTITGTSTPEWWESIQRALE
jgi:hypothetical protein